MSLTLSQAFAVQSPAKVNLHLYIQGKRPDGYHELALDLIPINLFDEIRFSPANQGLHLQSPDLGPMEENLVIRAIRLLEREAGQEIALEITLTKNVPHGAGLGGGSANAAATLVTLNERLQLDLTKERLQELALSLGADVPFFIEPRPSIATGIGEKMIPFALPCPFYLLLLYPGFGISTAEAYRLAEHSQRSLDPSQFSQEALSQLNPNQNDFWGPLSKAHPKLERAHQRLLDLKPDACAFSGSGSSLLALFFDPQSRDAAYQAYRPLDGERLFAVDPLDSVAY